MMFKHIAVLVRVLNVQADLCACECMMLGIPPYIELKILALIQRPCRVAVIDET